MVLIDSVKYACATCIKGHRSSTCNHDTRPLIEIRKKGRPVTQCVHCRELRKTKQVHVKCLCEGRPDSAASAPRTVIPSALSTPTSSSVSLPLMTSEPSCDCKTAGGSCECCTPKHAPRVNVSGGKPPGLTRGHTFHASTTTASSMSQDLGLDTLPPQRAGVRAGSGALQRSTSLHSGSAGAGNSHPTSSSHPHPHHVVHHTHSSATNPDGSHHPHPHHHSARHFAPYSVHHPLHHAHAHFDLPEDSDVKDQFLTEVKSEPIEEGIPRRHRSSSVSNGEAMRPFPPAPMYLNTAATLSLPDVLAWNSSSDLSMTGFPQQFSGIDYQSQQSLAGQESTPFLPVGSEGEYDSFPDSAEFIGQFGSNNSVVYDEPTSDGFPSAGVNEMTFSGGGEFPDMRIAAAEAGMGGSSNEASNDFELSEACYGVPPVENSSCFDTLMTFVTYRQQEHQAMLAAESASGTVGSSGPPSMTGSLTSRSSSRASGGVPSGVEMLEMTSLSATAYNPNLRARSADSHSSHRGRAPRAFPIADPFENEVTAGIAAFTPFDVALQPSQRLTSSVERKMPSLHYSPSRSPASQERGRFGGDSFNDKAGTHFPPWPQSEQQHPSPASFSSAAMMPSSSSSGHSPFSSESFEFSSSASAAYSMEGQRAPSLEIDDGMWAMRG